MNEKYRRAAELARQYNWPDEAAQLERGVIPAGFGKEVGQTIALFLAPDVISYAWWGVRGWTKEREEQERMDNRQHAGRLVELRLLLAQLSIVQRAGSTS